ncbi:MAG: hypothetical protein ACLRVU_01815 [Beduini sp.]|uniref:hypothetical protein n=1 Tax=Beduini sp. TaxID=1922300 RepID=UPI0039A20EF6
MKLKCQCGYKIKQEHGHQEDIKSGIKAFFFKCHQCGNCYTLVRYLNGNEETLKGYWVIKELLK